MMRNKVFDYLISLFKKNGFRIYMIGGTSRDFLLGLDFTDYDFVTDATPDEMKIFMPDANYRFASFGSVRYKVDEIKCDITTLRVENGYQDHRHPKNITFTKDLAKDVVRRDFTINALYIDEDMKVIDLVGGLNDLRMKIIRFIGNPEERIKEDPLRILRAERFQQKLGFEMEKETASYVKSLSYLINELNPEKVKEELKKRKL